MGNQTLFMVMLLSGKNNLDLFFFSFLKQHDGDTKDKLFAGTEETGYIACVLSETLNNIPNSETYDRIEKYHGSKKRYFSKK